MTVKKAEERKVEIDRGSLDPDFQDALIL